MSTFLSWLPLELRCRTVSFLIPSDALALSDQFGKDFGVTVSRLEPSHLLFQRELWRGDRVRGDDPVCSNYRIPVLQGGPVQSAVLSFRWRDQGFGERKGKLYVVAAADPPRSNTHPFGGGRVVCETELATHTMLPHEMVFVPRDSDVLTLWYKCGSGRLGQLGHQLHVEECSIRLYVFDDPEHNWANNYQRLHTLGAVGFPAQNGRTGGIDDDPDNGGTFFFPQMLLRVCKSLRRQLQDSKLGNTPLETEMVEFMKEYDIPVTDISLRSIEEMVKADMEDRSEFYKSQRLAREANRARQEQERRNGRGATAGAGFAFGPFVGGNGEAGIMFGGGIGIPEGLFGGDAGVGEGQGAQPIPDAFGAAMQDFIGHMNQMMAVMGDNNEAEDEEEDASDDEGIILD